MAVGMLWVEENHAQDDVISFRNINKVNLRIVICVLSLYSVSWDYGMDK